MNSASRVALIALLLVAVGGAFVWWRRQPPAPLVPPPAVAVAPPRAPTAAPTAPPPPAVPIRNLVAPAAGGGALPGLDDSDGYFKKVLDDLLGRKAVSSFLMLDGIARRFVATVSNLVTDNAAAGLWPVTKTGGHLVTQSSGSDTVISPQNAERYRPFVRFVEGIDTGKAVALYRTAYPLLQHAYEDLGFPGSYLNDRVVEVIDHLLATPDIRAPLQVKLVTVDGGARPAGAGLYVFADPTLEASSAGQKIMLRIGRENAATLKAKLADIRTRIAKGPA